MRGEYEYRQAQHDRPKDDPFARFNLLGESDIFRRTLRVIDRIAAVDATVLIQGETGTGKELAARAVHYLSRRRECPFIPVNCGALPDNLLESELFGHERGAFTDAKQARCGLVAQAEGGTLFFDEVEAMTQRGQVVLLRFLQDHTYRPVGGRLTSTGNVRVVASSNVDLESLVRRGQFRNDLLFRFGVLPLTMPPLRERGGDAILLARHFLWRLATEHGRPVKEFHPDSIAWICSHQWPGNVRELENLMLREFLLTDGDTIRINASHSLGVAESKSETYFDKAFKDAKAQAIAQFERDYLRRLLARTRGNVSLAARISHKDRSCLIKLAKKHGLTRDEFRLPSA
jgi:two-component system response regulator GlrR